MTARGKSLAVEITDAPYVSQSYCSDSVICLPTEKLSVKDYNAVIEWGKRVGAGVLTIKPAKQLRTISQNAYLHAILTLFAKHTGDSMTDVKTVLKNEAVMHGSLPPITNKSGTPAVYKGTEQLVPMSTADCTVKQLQTFIDFCCNRMADMGYVVPSEAQLEDYEH